VTRRGTLLRAPTSSAERSRATPEPGSSSEDPVTRQRIVFTRRSSDLVAGELFAAPGGFVPLHVHGSQVERFEGVSGELGFRLGRQTVGAGQSVRIDAGVPHGFRNAGPDIAHFLIELMPPRRGEEGLRTLFGLQRDGRNTSLFPEYQRGCAGAT
jgi:quercetin dioxygenase-like cupin family protein